MCIVLSWRIIFLCLFDIVALLVYWLYLVSSSPISCFQHLSVFDFSIFCCCSYSIVQSAQYPISHHFVPFCLFLWLLLLFHFQYLLLCRTHTHTHINTQCFIALMALSYTISHLPLYNFHLVELNYLFEIHAFVFHLTLRFDDSIFVFA